MRQLIGGAEGHTIELDLLPEAPTVLDVGCLGFEFTREMLKLRPRARIFAMDPAEIDDPGISGCTFLREALVAGDEAMTDFVPWSDDGMGDFIAKAASLHQWKCAVSHHKGFFKPVPCTNMIKLWARTGVDHFDVVKLDCEGSEFEILENWPNWPKPIATQISVEFHDVADRVRRSDTYFARLFAGLKEYKVAQHKLFEIADGSLGHWDSLLVLR